MMLLYGPGTTNVELAVQNVPKSITDLPFHP